MEIDPLPLVSKENMAAALDQAVYVENTMDHVEEIISAMGFTPAQFII